MEFLVSSEENNQTLISFIKRRFKTTPISLIYKLFRTKKVQLNQQDCRYYHYRLRTNDLIIINDKRLKLAPTEKHLPIIEPTIELEIIYEDQNILIVNKEHNVEIHNSKNKNCLDNLVRHYLYQQNPQIYQQQQKKFFIPVAVHRLDKLTKGLVIYPKNAISKKVLYNSINDKKKITKFYLAICENYQSVNLPSFVQGYIYKNEKTEKMEFSEQKKIPDETEILSQRKKEIKHCAMEIENLRKKGSYNLLKITLHTGRKHQIRAILSSFKTPVLGDKKYGGRDLIKNKIYLFAYQLHFHKIDNPLNYLDGECFSLIKLENDLINKFKTSSII